MKIIFFGNTKYSAVGLEIINQSLPVSAVVTLPDRPTGKNRNLISNPVKQLAQSLQIPVLEFETLTDKSIDEITKLDPEFFIVEDYGLIIPSHILKIPKIAPLNIHHSLLPKYRGPSPVPSAILEGEEKTGVSVILVAEKVDSGDILDQEEYKMTGDETTDSLLIQLNIQGANLLVEVIKNFPQITPKKQDESQTTFTKKFTKEDGYFDIENPPDPEKLDRMIRAYYPWPGAWTKWNGKIVKLLPNPSVIARSEATWQSRFLIQIEGKKAVALKDFLNGYPNFPLKLPSPIVL